MSNFWQKIRDINEEGLKRLWVVLSVIIGVIGGVIATIFANSSEQVGYFFVGALVTFLITFPSLLALGKGAIWVAKGFTHNDRNND